MLHATFLYFSPRVRDRMHRPDLHKLLITRALVASAKLLPSNTFIDIYDLTCICATPACLQYFR